jgi:hypothetical protein
MISGVGFASAKMIGSEFIDLICSSCNNPGLLTQMKISAHLIASSKVHEIWSIFQGAISCLYLFKSDLHSWITHFESRNIIFSAQAFLSNLPIAIAAAQAPEITIF